MQVYGTEFMHIKNILRAILAILVVTVWSGLVSIVCMYIRLFKQADNRGKHIKDNCNKCRLNKCI